MDESSENDIRHLIAMAHEEGDAALDLRLAWTTLRTLSEQGDWPAEMRRELDEITSELAKYIGKTELAKFGHGGPPADEDFDALVDRLCGLERFLPLLGRSEAPA